VISKTVCKFVVVSGCGSLAYILLSSVFLELGMAPGVASALGYALCIYPVYRTQRKLVFQTDVRDTSAFPRYVVVQALNLLWSGLIPEFLVNHGVLPLAAFFATNIFNATWSFVMQSRWVFRNKLSVAKCN